jgi:acetyl-CoA acetyltransferase
VLGRGAVKRVDVDEHPRADVSMDSLAALKPVR